MTFDPLTILSTLLLAGAVIYIVGFVVFHFTEIVKLASRWAAGLPAFNWVAIQGYASYLVALVLAAAAAFYPGSGISDLLAKLFTALNVPVNTTLVQLLTTVLVSLVAVAMHNSGKMPTPLKTSKTAK